MTSFTFNYDTFYDYYTDPKNVIYDKTDCVNMHYYVSRKNKTYVPAKISKDKCHHIDLNGQKIYVRSYSKPNNFNLNSTNLASEITSGIMFSMPTLIDGVLFYFHYHFGKTTATEHKIIRNKKYIKHKNIHNKTETNPSKKKKK